MITREGYEKLRGEVEELWKVERPRVTNEVEAAAALGDRSENAEYIYGKKRLREIDRRLRFLGKKLETLQVVDDAQIPRSERVSFGHWVDLEREDGDTFAYRVVGADESDADNGKVSIESPIGRAMLGKEVGDEVEVRTPRGSVYYEITGVRHPAD